ncbi:MAG: hypothetical protein ABIK68_04940 [bacterium]
MLFLILLLSQYACNEPRDRSSYSGSGKSYARVSVRVDDQLAAKHLRSSQRHLNISALPAPTGTALIIAVDAGTPFSEDYNSIQGFYDKQLVDLTTSTVTLTLPINTSLQLFEYTFNPSYSLNNLNSTNYPVFTKAVLGPFTLTGATTTIALDANLAYALSGPFSTVWNNGSANIEIEHDNGKIYYMYETMNWQTLAGINYVFDPVSRTFTAGQYPKSGFELIGGEWIERSSRSPTSTFDRVDHENYTVYYRNPDFSATLIGIIDLPFQGFEGNPGEDSSDKDQPFMEANDFSSGALGYALEIHGQTEAEYRLEMIAESHDCSKTQFTSLGGFISFHTSSEFTCQDQGDGPCLRFDSYTPGQTGGSIIEVIRDDQHNIISQTPAGTWEIKNIQTREILFFYPNSTAYYHDGGWAPFWSVMDGKVWEGYRPAGGEAEEAMVFITFNDIAISDYQNFLKAAPSTFFVDDYIEGGDDSCSSSQNWGQAIWGNFTWGP